MPDFRTHDIENTCTKTYKVYGSYKPWLITDFKQKCGYCNDHDLWAGGKRGMQIDHFAPKKKFPDHECTYDNLVYSCFYCNNHKSDDWVTEHHNQPVSDDNLSGYIHPRGAEYTAAFTRDDDGKIVALTDVAKYMHRQLCLGLKRHELIHKLEELFDLREQLNQLVIDESIPQDKRDILVNQRKEISDKFMDYLTEYRQTLNN